MPLQTDAVRPNRFFIVEIQKFQNIPNVALFALKADVDQFSPDSDPSRCWIVGSEGERDAANLSEDS